MHICLCLSGNNLFSAFYILITLFLALEVEGLLRTNHTTIKMSLNKAHAPGGVLIFSAERYAPSGSQLYFGLCLKQLFNVVKYRYIWLSYQALHVYIFHVLQNTNIL